MRFSLFLLLYSLFVVAKQPIGKGLRIAVDALGHSRDLRLLTYFGDPVVAVSFQ